MNVSYQIAMHAQALCRWFAKDKAVQEATRRVKSGRAWKWHEPKQFELFEDANP